MAIFNQEWQIVDDQKRKCKRLEGETSYTCLILCGDTNSEKDYCSCYEDDSTKSEKGTRNIIQIKNPFNRDVIKNSTIENTKPLRNCIEQSHPTNYFFCGIYNNNDNETLLMNCGDSKGSQYDTTIPFELIKQFDELSKETMAMTTPIIKSDQIGENNNLQFGLIGLVILPLFFIIVLIVYLSKKDNLSHFKKKFLKKKARKREDESEILMTHIVIGQEVPEKRLMS